MDSGRSGPGRGDGSPARAPPPPWCRRGHGGARGAPLRADPDRAGPECPAEPPSDTSDTSPRAARAGHRAARGPLTARPRGGRCRRAVSTPRSGARRAALTGSPRRRCRWAWRSSCTAAPGKVGWKSPGLSRARATRAYAHIALRPARRGSPARKFPRRKIGQCLGQRRPASARGSGRRSWAVPAPHPDHRPEESPPPPTPGAPSSPSLATAARGRVRAARPERRADRWLMVRLVRFGRAGRGVVWRSRSVADRRAAGVFPGWKFPGAAAGVSGSQRDVRVGARRARTRGAPGISFARDRHGGCPGRIPARSLGAVRTCPVTVGRGPVLSRRWAGC